MTVGFWGASPGPPGPSPPPGEEKVSSPSSPRSLRSTPFSLCYNQREPAAAIASQTCQSSVEPAPEVARSSFSISCLLLRV